MLEEIKKTFVKVFKVDESVLDENTSINNLAEWDSMRHLELITALEKDLQVKFKMSEMISLDSIAKIIEVVEKKKVR